MTASATNPTADKQAPTSASAAAPQSADKQDTAAAPLHVLAPEMRKQWSKFSDADLAGVKSQDDLTAKVEMTYAVSHDDAKKQVQNWAQGRQF